jgi:hypothetical protein
MPPNRVLDDLILAQNLALRSAQMQISISRNISRSTRAWIRVRAREDVIRQ